MTLPLCAGGVCNMLNKAYIAYINSRFHIWYVISPSGSYTKFVRIMALWPKMALPQWSHV